MKIACTLLVVVIALHSQCLASCYGMHVPLAVPASDAAPPCHGDHGQQGDQSPPEDHSADHSDSACGLGPVTPSKSALTLEGTLHVLPPFAVDPLPIVQDDAFAAVVPFGWPPPSTFSPALLLKLRI
jgi:hypothetical protein